MKIQRFEPYVKGVEFPHVDILMINSRRNRGGWFLEALMSCKRQVYPSFSIIVFDNNMRKFSIGYCWNFLVNVSNSELVYFVGDDDYITPDMLISSVSMWIEAGRLQNKAELVTSYITEFAGKKEKLKASCPTGLWERKYLAENPFDEEAVNLVDRKYFDNFVKNKETKHLVMHWHFGYNERIHPGKVSLIHSN